MGIRTAIEQNAVVTFGLIFLGVWVGMISVRVFNVMGGIEMGNWVGRHGIGGLMGLIVMLVFIGLLIVTFGELGETDPAPGKWPPE